MLNKPRLVFYILVANLVLLMFARQIDSPMLFLIIILLNFFVTASYPLILILGKLKVNKYLIFALSFLLTAVLFYLTSTVTESLNTALFILFFMNLASVTIAFVNRYRVQPVESYEE